MNPSSLSLFTTALSSLVRREGCQKHGQNKKTNLDLGECIVKIKKIEIYFVAVSSILRFSFYRIGVRWRKWPAVGK